MEVIYGIGGTSLWFPYKNCFWILLCCHRIVQMGGYLFWKVLFVFSFSSIFSRSCPRIRCTRPFRPRSRQGSSRGCRGRPKHLLSPTVCCPRRCSWSRRILPGVVVRTLRMRLRWRRRWCCRASTWPTLDPLECRTAAPSRRRYQSRRHNRSERMLLRWCHFRDLGKSVCTCRRECPTVLRMRRRLPRRMLCCQVRVRETWRLRCGQCKPSSADQSRCPTRRKSYLHCWWQFCCHLKIDNNLGSPCDLAALGLLERCPREISGCKLNKCCLDHHRQRMTRRVRRRMSWPMTTSGEWRKLCWCCSCPKQSVFRLGKQTPDSSTLRPSAWRKFWRDGPWGSAGSAFGSGRWVPSTQRPEPGWCRRPPCDHRGWRFWVVPPLGGAAPFRSWCCCFGCTVRRRVPLKMTSDDDVTWQPPDQVVFQLQFLVQEIPFPNKWATTALCQLWDSIQKLFWL